MDLRLILILSPDDWQAEASERLPFTEKIFWFDAYVTWGRSHTRIHIRTQTG